MKLVIYIVVGVLALAGAAGGAFFVAGGDVSQVAELLEGPDPNAPLPPPPPGVEPVPYHLGSIPAPIYRGGNIQSFVFVDITFQVRGDRNTLEVAQWGARLTDAIQRDFYRHSLPLLPDRSDLDWPQIEARVAEHLHTYVKRGVVTSIDLEYGEP